jgi:phosphoribosylformimino-5-aminoimidazole carboxamide ribotide isomerase
MMEGPATELYSALLKSFTGLRLIASGGVRDMNDIFLLDETGCTGVIVGKAIYEGGIKLKELEKYAG